MEDKSYPDIDFASVYWWAAQRSYGDDIMSCPSEHVSRQLGAQLLARTRQSNLYFYHFEYAPTHVQSDVTRHVSELQYVFHQSELTSQLEDAEMADVCSYWGNFISGCGNPNNITTRIISHIPEWDSYSVEVDNVQVIKTATDIASAVKLKAD